MKKVVMFLALLVAFISVAISPNCVNAEVASADFVCIVNYCYLYSAPSTSSAKVYTTSKTLAKVFHKDIVKVECEDDAPVVYGNKNAQFYKLTDTTYYDSAEEDAQVCEAYIYAGAVTQKASYVQITPSFNAEINSEDVVFYQKNGDGEETTLDDGTKAFATGTLSFGTRIYLYQGYDFSRSFTAIAAVVDGDLQYGYVKTEAIQPDGINPMIIYAITIALGCIGIITALLFMKNKKKKV